MKLKKETKKKFGFLTRAKYNPIISKCESVVRIANYHDALTDYYKQMAFQDKKRIGVSEELTRIEKFYQL